jgi:imidazolonepropionase
VTRDGLLFVNARQVVTCAGAARGRRGIEMADAVVRTGVAVLVEGDLVSAVDDEPALRARARDATVVDCGGGVLTPGFVDSHTHAIFGRAR